MSNLKNLFSFLILAITISFTACTPEVTTVSISGTVTNGTTALNGATVTASSGETTTTGASGDYSITAAKDGTLTFKATGYTSKTINIDGQTTIDVTLIEDAWVASFDDNGNSVMDPQFPSNSIIPSITLAATVSTDPWFSQTANYKGAVASAFGAPWYDGWSFYSRIVNGNTTSAPLNTAGKPVVTVTDAWMQAQGTSVTWTASNIYLLDGFVFVGSTQTLTIDAGTIIQGKAGSGANASALIVARGGVINAVGTATDPIVFTYEGDNGGASASDRGRWGGLIILGAAGLNSTPGETQIEGIPTSETRGLYGGSNNIDNSGTLRYVSIRHGGSNIGNDNEINGLTLGGVGSGTILEYIEIVANKDDGIEWFGGTANVKYLIAAYCGDDALDYDEGYRGKNQFIIIHQDPAASAADRGGEHDGGTSPETGTPFATPQFWNVTSSGNATSKAITFRDNAGGQYHNSVFLNFGKGIDIEDLEGQDQDSYKQFVEGNLIIANSVFFNIGAGSTGKELFTVSN
jgi:hypothetical protein